MSVVLMSYISVSIVYLLIIICSKDGQCRPNCAEQTHNHDPTFNKSQTATSRKARQLEINFMTKY